MKKLLSVLMVASFLSLSLPMSVMAYGIEDNEIEHIQLKKDSKVNLVKVTDGGNIIQKENYIIVNFAQNFNSKFYKPGDYVQFTFDEDLKTQEGTLLIPMTSSLIAKVTEITPPKWFSRNAKVYMEFTHIVLPDGTNIPVYLQKAKKEYFKEGAKETAGKIGAYTLAIGGVGAGLGAAIGVAAGHTITGLIIGGSIGGGVGLVTGIVSPGLHFKAKKGEAVTLELQDNLKLPNK